jgi:hypothetical protein
MKYVISKNPGYSEKGSLLPKSRVFSKKRDLFRNEILFRNFSNDRLAIDAAKSDLFQTFNAFRLT